MKKKLLTLLMAMTMTAMLFTGCGEKEADSDDVKASVEESKEEKEESKEESKEVAEESTEEVVEEVVESTEEVVETEEEETVIADGEDWSNAYDDYFSRDDIMSEKTQITCAAVADEMTFDLIIAMDGDNMRMCYEFDEAMFDMYATKEKIYAFVEMQGESQWIWAPVESEEDVDTMFSMSDTGVLDTDAVESVNYRETVEEDGVIYDVLDVLAEGTEATYFVNRETQKIEKCVMDQDGVAMVMLIDEIESLEIPAEAEDATESTAEEVMMTMLAVLFSAASVE